LTLYLPKKRPVVQEATPLPMGDPFQLRHSPKLDRVSLSS
jgi:hypothetical protein